MKPAVEFIDRIWRGQAAQAADAVLSPHADGDAAMTRALRDACTAITRRMVAICPEIRAACETAGVAARAETGPEDADAVQFHATSIGLPPSALAAALEVAEGFGFRPTFRPGPGQVEAVGRYLSELTLVRGAATGGSSSPPRRATATGPWGSSRTRILWRPRATAPPAPAPTPRRGSDR